MQRYFTVIVSLLSFLCVLLQSPAVEAKEQRAPIAVLIKNTSNPYWKVFYDGVKEAGDELGRELDIYTVSKAVNAEEQLNQCEAALLKNPEAIIVTAINGVNLGPCLRKADERGIMIVDSDGNIDEGMAENMGITMAFSVASNNYDLGAKAAQYLTGRTGKVLVLEGAAGTQPSRLRIKGFADNLPEEMEIVASQPADWDRLRGNDITRQTLTAHPDLAAVFAANDTMALGAVEALRAAGNENVAVVGIDGTADAVTSIRDGRLSASIAQLPYLMGRQAVLKTVKQLAGEETYDFNQYVPILTLDRKTLEAGDSELLEYLR